MRTLLRVVFLVSIAVAAGGAAGDEDRSGTGYTIRSLNLPDPIFLAGDSIQIRVTAESDAAARRAGITLNGDDVTAAFSPAEPGALVGTVSDLQPGINTFNVFRTRADR